MLVIEVLYRFDECGVHEALKEFSDLNISHLASCYIGDAEDFNEGKIVYLRRTQTLHHGKKNVIQEFWLIPLLHSDSKE